MTVYLLDANVVSASTVQSQLEKGDRSVLTGNGYLAQTNGVSVWPIKNWTMPTGGKKIGVTGDMFLGRSDVLLVYLTDAATTSAMFAVAEATNSVYVYFDNPSAVFVVMARVNVSMVGCAVPCAPHSIQQRKMRWIANTAAKGLAALPR